MRTFIENYLHFIKNCIRPPYKKLKSLKSGFIENSNFENNRDPCFGHFDLAWHYLVWLWIWPDQLATVYVVVSIKCIWEKTFRAFALGAEVKALGDPGGFRDGASTVMQWSGQMNIVLLFHGHRKTIEMVDTSRKNRRLRKEGLANKEVASVALAGQGSSFRKCNFIRCICFETGLSEVIESLWFPPVFFIFLRFFFFYFLFVSLYWPNISLLQIFSSFSVSVFLLLHVFFLFPIFFSFFYFSASSSTQEIFSFS